MPRSSNYGTRWDNSAENPDRRYSRLPLPAEPLAGTALPFSSKLLTLRRRVDRDSRQPARVMAGAAATAAMPVGTVIHKIDGIFVHDAIAAIVRIKIRFITARMRAF